ncbi:SDR family oxidoreductase [Aneurinibacillus sp. BA2021]|nr:SDR family oxidoreductase [Aneurinibacillus sp. BA2021]
MQIHEHKFISGGFWVKGKKEHGRLDVMINNAGVSRWKSPYEITVEEWDDILNMNLRGVFLGAWEAAKLMRKHGGGSIVNIASTRAFMSEPDSEAYAASISPCIVSRMVRCRWPFGQRRMSLRTGRRCSIGACCASILLHVQLYRKPNRHKLPLPIVESVYLLCYNGNQW